MQSQLIRNRPAPEYHADRTSISQSDAKLILKSPGTFLEELNSDSKSTRQLDLGSFTNDLILGQPTDQYFERTWTEGWNTIAAREACADYLVTRQNVAKERVYDDKGKALTHTKLQAVLAEENLIDLSQEDWKTAHRMHDAVRANPRANDLFSNGWPEVSAYADCPVTGIRMRGRFDWLRRPGQLIDLKTARDGSANGFRKASLERGYIYQAAWYEDLYDIIVAEYGLSPRKGPFEFVIVQSVGRPLVSFASFPDHQVARAKKEMLHARVLYRDATLLDEWPDYPDGKDSFVIEMPEYFWATKPVLV